MVICRTNTKCIYLASYRDHIIEELAFLIKGINGGQSRQQSRIEVIREFLLASMRNFG